MVLLSSEICDFGKKPKNFLLKSVNDDFYDWKNVKGKSGTLVMFICNHCPYVKAIIEELVRTTKLLESMGVRSVAIMPNDALKYPEDSFEKMKVFSNSNKFNFPYLYDESQKTAKAFGAVCTPDFYGYNSNDELQYRGRLCELKNLEYTKNSRNELLIAMTEISKTGKGPFNQNPSVGCSIKWK
tara:strand:- start:142 stop:693 length:552 start_codon:yes stop_codon:yes gene_type:complete